jgi:microcystin-dependent protein
MSDPYLGEIRLTGFNYAPQGWAFCNGDLLPISEFDALFNLLGTTYGGDGQSTFGLPDLRGRVPIHTASAFPIGQSGGQESVALNAQQIPAHDHPSAMGTSQNASSGTPANGATWAVTTKGPVYLAATPAVAMAAQAIGMAGGGQPHENRQPSLAVNYIIALLGVYPSQN